MLVGQQVIDLGPWEEISSASHSGGVTTFNTTTAHGLMVGNSFRVLNASDANLGDFVVKAVTDFNTFTATTTSALTSPAFILKHGLSANEALSGTGGENIGVRGLSIFDHETLIADRKVEPNETTIKVKLPGNLLSGSNVGQDKNVLSIRSRFPVGSYIQIDGEIMRVSSNVLTGSNDEISVIRGALATIIPAEHPIGSVIKKIKPLPIELRRPSILRASGHTFEYLGYGPGNYSTALPQLQNRSLTEREEFLSQSQETSCGNVVYTGMNDKGDFYIGNTKISSSSGQQTTFDIPIPTITGEDPNRLSIVADEVIVKERLLVEGGVSKQILSQFDGPVTFNENVRLSNVDKSLTVVGKVNFTNTTNPTSITSPASLKVMGGVGIAKSVYIGGDLIGAGTFDGQSNISGITSVTAVSFFGDGAGLTNTGATLSESTSNIDERVVLTDKTSGTMTTAKTDGDLKFNFSTNKLTCGDGTNGGFVGKLEGNVIGDLTGTADKATDVVGAANRVLYNSATDDTTTSANLTFDGTTLAPKQVVIANTDKIFFGSTSSGLNISYTDATNQGSKIVHNGTDDLRLQISANQFIIEKTTGDNFQLADHSTGEVRLYHAGNGGKLTTTADGVNITGTLRASDDIIAFSSSDINLKENITVIPNALDKVNSLSGNTFKWKTSATTPEYFQGITDDTGVIAQEVEALGLPGITTTRDDGTKAVRYERLIPVLIQAVKELSAKVTALEGS